MAQLGKVSKFLHKMSVDASPFKYKTGEWPTLRARQRSGSREYYN